MSGATDSIKRLSLRLRNSILSILGFRIVLKGEQLQTISTRLLFSDDNNKTDLVSQSTTDSSLKNSNSGDNQDSIVDRYSSFISHQSIASGWYMLEVSVNLNLIGSDFILQECAISTRSKDREEGRSVADLSVRSRWNILLGSHSLTKRLIFVPEPTQEEKPLIRHSLIAFSIEGNVCLEDFPLVVISRVTQEFALSRMQKKLNYASGFTASEMAEQSANSEISKCDRLPSSATLPSRPSSQLYARYDGLFKRHIQKTEYNKWLKRREVINDHSVPVVQPSCHGPTTSGAVHLSIVLTSTKSSEAQIESLVQALSIVVDNPINQSIQFILYASPGSIYLLKQSLEFKAHKQLKFHEVTGNLVSASLEGYKDERIKAISSVGERHFHLLMGESVILSNKSLIQFVNCIKRNPLIKIVYSDHDVINTAGLRNDPVFKPEWNPELMLNSNYIGNCFLIESRNLESSACWNPGLELAAFYQCLLTCAFSCDDHEIYRISNVLWHREAETALKDCPHSLSGKNTEAYHFGTIDDKNVLQNLLPVIETEDSIEIEGSIETECTNGTSAIAVHNGKRGSTTVLAGMIPGSLRIQRSLPAALPSVEIVIPTRDRADILKLCIDSLLGITEYENFRITVVDNESIEPETLSYFDQLTNNSLVQILPAMGEFNYSRINNIAVQQSTADIVVLLNNDTEIIHADWLKEMTSHAIRPEIGCVGAKLIYSNNRIQHAGVLVGLKGMAGHAHRFSDRMDDGYCGRLKFSQNVSAVTAACLAVRRSVYNEVQGLDEVNLKVAYNDVDFCLRVRELGYRNLWTPYAELYHHESVSRGSDDSPAKQKRFRQEYAYMREKWNTDTFVDPAYNPNLSKDLENFSLAA